jgi:hypothetical protein
MTPQARRKHTWLKVLLILLIAGVFGFVPGAGSTPLWAIALITVVAWFAYDIITTALGRARDSD